VVWELEKRGMNIKKLDRVERVQGFEGQGSSERITKYTAETLAEFVLGLRGRRIFRRQP
jgi:hypothetical protein